MVMMMSILTQPLLPALSLHLSYDHPLCHSDDDNRLAMVYPYGVSLNVSRPARPILSSGPVSFPMNRPIAAMWESETVGSETGQRGRLLVLGSAEIFGDDWLDKEENAKVCDMLFSWLLNEAEFEMSSDRQDSELSDYHPVPHIESISTSIKPCLQDLDELPRDFTRLFDMTMMKFDTNLIPETLKTYDALGEYPHSVFFFFFFFFYSSSLLIATT